MRILLTGGSGFLGRNVINVLTGHEIISVARKEGTILADLSKSCVPLPCCDIVIHTAGKAHSIPHTNEQIKEFSDVNINGTANLLDSLENLAIPRAFVFISSVAVYGKFHGLNINEDAPLLASDPYGISKILAEKLVVEWCKKNNVICTILRLPLIAGPCPPGNLKALINGVQRGYYFNIGKGQAKKSMVLAEDVAKIIPRAAEVGGTYNLTDGYHPSFKELGDLIAAQLCTNKPRSIPFGVAKSMALIGDLIGNKAPINSFKLRKMVSDLTFNDSKARKLLDWRPIPVLKGFKVK